MTTIVDPSVDGVGGLVVEDLHVSYAGTASPALAALSLEVGPGRTLGVVGESGSGKSTVLRAVTGLLRPPAVVGASRIELGGRDLSGLSSRQWRGLRGSELALVFQDPLGAFNPAMTVGAQFHRHFRLHQPTLARRQRMTRALRSLELVGLGGRELLTRHPFQLSQGQLQRISIALACSSPHLKLLLADEPTASLDVTTQAQVIDLLRDLQSELGFAMVLVSHNLAVVAEMCDDVLVLRAGEVVERRDAVGLFTAPEHDYTGELLGSMTTLPTIEPEVEVE